MAALDSIKGFLEVSGYRHLFGYHFCQFIFLCPYKLLSFLCISLLSSRSNYDVKEISFMILLLCRLPF